MNLFDLEPLQSIGTRTRSATDREQRAYLKWLAEQRGVEIPKDATFSPDGIWTGKGKDAERIITMPGYGMPDVVTMELLDDSGAVVRTSRIGLDNKGALKLKADQVVEATGLKKQRKAPVAPRRFPIEPGRALKMSAAEMQAYCDRANGRPERTAENAPAPAPAVRQSFNDYLAAQLGTRQWVVAARLTQRLRDRGYYVAIRSSDLEAHRVAWEALGGEAAGEVATPRVEKPRIRIRLVAVPVEPAPVVEMTVTPDHENDEPATLPADARALAFGGRWAASLDQVEASRARRLRIAHRYLSMRRERAEQLAEIARVDAARAAAAARADRLDCDNADLERQRDAAVARADAMQAEALPAIDEAHGRVVKLEREVATWRARAERAGWRPTFNLAGLMTGRTAQVRA